MGALTLYRVALQLVGLTVSQALDCTNRLYMASYEQLEETLDSGTAEADFVLGLTSVKCQFALTHLAEALAIHLTADEMFDQKLIVRKIAEAFGKPIPKEAEED